MLAYRDEKKKPYSQTYLKTLHNQLSAIFNHAVRYYELRSNPAAKVGNMGSEEHKEMKFWTKEEYKKFAFEMMDKPVSFYAFEMLYWCGIREGELLALTAADFNFDKETVTINKSYQRLHNELINKAVALSGLPKQEYCYRRCLNQDVVVQGNPRVYKALKTELAAVLTELQRIEAGKGADEELLNVIELIAVILGGMKGDGENGE